jgi:GDSL-like Lipase/Acylhydrolase family
VIPAISWRFIEDPIRRGALGRMWEQRRLFTLGSWLRSGWKPAAVLVSLTLLTTACVGMSSDGPKSDPLTSAASITMSTSPTPPPLPSAAPSEPASPSASPTPTGSATPTIPPISTATTSCRSIVHIGDSTSDGLISADYLPDPRQRLGDQYARRGVRTVHWEISGGRSVVETLEGQANAYTVAQRQIRAGYHGCWVLALGTNDTADLAVGSTVGLSTRIAEMMKEIGGQPVMWVNTISLLDSGPYSEADMQAWNQALLRACPRYPNMRVYDWAAVARRRWFIDDGIHYTSAGYAARSRLIAQALAEAFPAAPGGAPGQPPMPAAQSAGPDTSCVVH